MGNPFGTFKFPGSTCSGLSCEYFEQEARYSQNEAELHNFGCRRHFVGRSYSPCTPIMNRFSGLVEHASPFSPSCTPSSKLIADNNRYVGSPSTCSSHYVGRDPSQKLVILYNWYLIRVGDSCIENGINPDGIRVAVGGHTQSGEKFETGPIEYRKEKCKLRTVDGLNVLLIGAINEQYTYNNGFPFNAIHIFFTGFPFNWNHIIIQCFMRPSLETNLPSACAIKESTSQEKNGVLSEFPAVQTDIAGIGKLNLQEPKQNLLNVISPRASVVRCTKRGRSESQPLRSSKRLKGGTGRTESEPAQQHLCVRSQKFSSKKSQINGDSVKNAKCILRSTIPQNMNRHKQIEDQIATTGKIEIGHAKEEDNDSFTGKEGGAYCRVNGEVNRSPISNLQNKTFEQSNDNYCSVVKQEIESGTLAVEHTFEDQAPDLEIPVRGVKMQRHRYVCKSTVKKNGRSKSSSNYRKVSPKVPDTLLLDEATVKNGIQKSSDGIDANHSEELGKENTSTMRRRRKSTVNKMWRSKRKSSCRKGSTRVPRTFLVDKATVKNGIQKNSDGIEAGHDKELCKESIAMVLTFEQAFENHTTFSVDTEHRDFGCRKGSNQTNGKEQVDNNFADLQKKASSASEQTKSSLLAESHLHNDINKVKKCVRSSNTKRGRSREVIPKHADLFCMESEGLVCDEATVIEDTKQKSEDISAIPAGDFDLVASKSGNDKSGHFTEIGGNTSKKKGNKGLCVGSMDNLETGKTDTERDACSGQVKRQQSVTRKPPPLPSPRVQTTPEEVSKAFGLKTSRSGRLLVPPLAHWCNQAIAYDLDGGIIAIIDGSTEQQDDHGCFKPPKQPEAVKIQQKLYNAANEIVRTPKAGKKAGVQLKD